MPATMNMFNWLREEASKLSFERCGNEGMGGQKVVAMDDLSDIIARVEAKWKENEAKNDWIPVGRTLPYPAERVQVTYKGYKSGELLCNAMAYVDPDGEWHWDDPDGTLPVVEITAWKRPGEPYRKGK